MRSTIDCVCLMWTLSSDQFEFDIEMEELKYYSNDEMLRQVWINLISNAIKFTPENGKIFVRAKRDGGSVSVTVSDTGCGMDEKTMDRIFDKFYQADTSRSTQGNGLGLALVKRVVDIMQGEISVESAPGKGSTFTVKFRRI